MNKHLEFLNKEIMRHLVEASPKEFEEEKNVFLKVKPCFDKKSLSTRIVK